MKYVDNGAYKILHGHLYKIGKTVNPTCRRHKKAVETAKHMILIATLTNLG